MPPRSCSLSRRPPGTSSSSWGMVSVHGHPCPQAWPPSPPLHTAISGDSGLTGSVPSGMGVSTVTAARILKGQMNGKLGPETPLAMDQFPYTALAKVRAGGLRVPQSTGWGVSRVWQNGRPGREEAQGRGSGPSHDLGICPRVDLRVSLSPDIQCGQTSARQRRHGHGLPVWG